MYCCCCSVTKLCPTLCDPWTVPSPHCPSSCPRVHPSSCPLNRWCHSTISSSAALFSFCLQSFPASGSFPMSWLFTSSGKKLEHQLQHQSFQWIFRVDFLEDQLVWSLCSLRDFRSLLQHHNSKASSLRCSAFFMVQVSHPYMTTGKNYSFDWL